MIIKYRWLKAAIKWKIRKKQQCANTFILHKPPICLFLKWKITNLTPKLKSPKLHNQFNSKSHQTFKNQSEERNKKTHLGRCLNSCWKDQGELYYDVLWMISLENQGSCWIQGPPRIWVQKRLWVDNFLSWDEKQRGCYAGCCRQMRMTLTLN